MIFAKKLKVRELTKIEKEKLLEFMMIKRKNMYLFISIILFITFTLNISRYFFMEDNSSIVGIFSFYIVLVIISFFPYFITNIRDKLRIHRIKNGNVTGVRARCSYGRYNSHVRHKVNGHPVYEIITEFESKMVVEPNVYGTVIRANTNFYVIRFGKKDTVYCNFDISE